LCDEGAFDLAAQRLQIHADAAAGLVQVARRAIGRLGERSGTARAQGDGGLRRAGRRIHRRGLTIEPADFHNY
jgi:hypothetical protein